MGRLIPYAGKDSTKRTGRPLTARDAKTERFETRMHADVKMSLVKLAVAERRTLASLVDEAIDDLLRKRGEPGK